MNTPYSVPIQAFFRKVEEDQKFFNYVNLDDEESMRLAHDRAKSYLIESIDRLISEGKPSIDFTDRSDEDEIFNFSLTAEERLILPSLMYEFYLERDIAYLKTLSVNYAPSSVKVFDPSNARSTFRDIYNDVQTRNKELLNNYKDTDRETGQYKSVNFSSYDEA